MTADPPPFIYDEAPYPYTPHRMTRPEHLELVARLFHLSPPPATEARVLEIGCAGGGNILPLAERFPGARFVGVDLSRAQIEAGQRIVDEAGIDNVELRQLDLAKIDSSFGEFDYIIAHGVYSWVPETVREALLAVIKARLAPRGVALVSHNVKPGWHWKAMAREMMLWHTRDIGDVGGRIEQSRAMLELLMYGARPEDRLYRAMIADQLQEKMEMPDLAFFHDDLAEVCDGCYLHEFVARLQAHGLAFLSDAHVELMSTNGFAPQVVGLLSKIAKTVVEREQYLDFLRNRKFRFTLITQDDARPRYQIAPAQIQDLWLASSLAPAAEEAPDPRAPGELTFTNQMHTVVARDPLSKAALLALGGLWPRPIHFAEVCARAAAMVGGPWQPEHLVGHLAREMLACFTGGGVELTPRDPGFAIEPPERPRTTGLVRLAAAEGHLVPSFAHLPAELIEEQRRVLQLLDGTRDRTDLAVQLGYAEGKIAQILNDLSKMALVLDR